MTTIQNPKVDNQSRWDGGIADYEKDAALNEAAFLRSIDYRTNPREVTLLPKTSKESGSVLVDLPKDGDKVGTDVYYYGDAGNIYKRTTAGSHALVRTVASSHGNGMKYYAEDDFLYYTSDKLIGRYGQISGTPAFADDFLGSEGGVPLNTHWIDFESGSSQYASRADTASLSITGDLAMEMTIKPESLPSVGNSMVLMSKWDVNANKRSYKFEIYAVSGYFGDGSDGALTISADTTEAPIDSACTGTSGATTLSATNASFASGQIILIHQTQGTGAGTWQRNKISGYTAGTITLETALNATYSSGAQVRVMKQYTNVTIDSGFTYTAKAWNGTVGGILAFIANGTFSGAGNITATGKGFRGGAIGAGDPSTGTQGESGTGLGTTSQSANGAGGGGGNKTFGEISPGGGGGGGNGTAGANGTDSSGSHYGIGGSTAGTADLTTFALGGGGGGGAAKDSGTPTAGANGGGGLFVNCVTFSFTGNTTANGNSASNASGSEHSAGGGGAGGSILINAQVATLGASLVSATGGSGGVGAGTGGSGGNGGVGRIHLNYLTSYTGTTSPTLDVTQDNTLVTTTTYQLRLGLSSNGTAEEFLTKNTSLAAAQTNHVGVSWDASASTATFFVDGVSIGTATGAVTSLNDNASVFAIAADFNTTARNFYDGKMDEARLWNTERTAAQMFANKSVQIAVNSAGLAAYYKLNNSVDDETSNANHLTASGSPTYATDVPFASPTSRLDLDQSLDTSGNTYTLATSISETATHRQTFVPAKDPQKSIEVLVAAIGTGNWTLTVHDSLNRTITSVTKTNAQMSTGDVEFIFSSVWRPIIGASYHFHLTSTVADGTVTTTSASDLETVDFHTYYQFLVTDTDYHPIEHFLNFLVIGNERYVATYSASAGYTPHKITLPPGWRIRCYAIWRGYLAIGCWKGTNIYDTDQGMIFLWDGYSTTYQEAIPIPEGAVNAMLSTKGELHVWAGYHGDKFVYNGGDSVDETQIKRVPKMTGSKYIETFPKAVTMWDALVRWGVAGNSNSSDVERGVYTHGRRKATSPKSLSYDFPISTGSRATTNVQIGFLFPIDRKLLIGWKDNTAYGVDVVDPTGVPFATGTIERGVADYGGVYKLKKALTIRADIKSGLASGESVKLKYKLDRATNWTEGASSAGLGYAATAGDTQVRLPVNLGNHKEVQIAADIGSNGSTAPTLTELTLEEDMMPTDKMI